MSEPPERTALYRLYDAAGQLLYIGITDDTKQRFLSHANRQPWWQHVARKDVNWLQAARREALQIEAAAIRDEHPLHNGKHNDPHAPFTAETWPPITAPPRGKAHALAELVRAEIASGRWAPGDRVPKARDISNASGVSESTAALAYRYLKTEGVLVFRFGRGIFVA